MPIWKKNYSLDQLNLIGQNCAIAHLGIKFSAKGDDWLEAEMPVDRRTLQPMGFLHGGISAALAETVASLAGYCCVDEGQAVVGTEINASHLRPVSSGYVTARATPIRLGKSMQVWQIDIRNSEQKLCCSSRLTLSVIHDK
ncbi:uncharacterized protein (TIGR00369 family) [Mesocricetibacter intestinalis]|uniref:Uncharacterized protein (TIGR00369 family) n=1 Tax=Mesocricetibacter intestinalis TaxID=1521930 RepID=A0A4R6VAZ7_9PAST|nr:hotdog fold thioesterase [Mesocricetibacter intestinalis]TDQ57174.1 uncharacterized protein (TIGR00369 family) [Mesocricetibacter intestinalis]